MNVVERYRKPAECRKCGTHTRSASRICAACRGVPSAEPQPGRPKVEEQAAWVAMRERVLKDLGYKPGVVRYERAEAVLRDEGVPDLPDFLTMLRGASDAGLSVGVPGVRGGVRGRVRAVLGAADPTVGSADPGVLAAGRGAGGGPVGPELPVVGDSVGEDATGEAAGQVAAEVVGTGVGGEAGEEAGAEEEVRVGVQVRLTRYWCGVTAGTVGVTAGSVVREGVMLVRVQLPSFSLFGTTVTVPVQYTELAS
ncbi:MAG: hypothetical protein VKJ09_15825 [Leptolyngbya sp.]|nr:hypothetical protein [Leptolyngbya sp.]